MAFTLGVGFALATVSMACHYVSDRSHLLLAFEEMPKKPVTRARKSASQERSKATVDTLLAATARVLVKEGYDHASTNKIADAAGVSIGSLYQYFPSKEALVAAVVERHMDTICSNFTAKMAEVADQPMKDVIRELIRRLIELKLAEPKLHRVLVEQIPRVGRLNRMREIEERVGGLMRIFFEARKDEIRIRNLDAAIFMLVTIGVSYSHAIAIEAPPNLTVEEMTEEFVELVTGYLLHDG